MKHLMFTLLLAVAMFTGAQSQEVTKALNDVQKVNAIRTDPDWQYMAEINMKVSKIMIEKSIKVAEIKDTDDLIAKLGFTKAEFETINTNYVAAAKRLKTKIDVYMPGATCTNCALPSDTKKKLIDQANATFKEKPAEMNRYFKMLSAKYTTVQEEEAGLCCGIWFYACVALCAATIEVFPVYLACCAYCYHAECCSAS